MAFRRYLAGLALGTSLIGAVACSRSETPADSNKPAEPLFKPVDPAQVTDALSTPGVIRYWGLLPCADCAGIRTELMLVQDPRTGAPQTYELTETHLGTMSQDEKPMTTRGKWSIAKGLGGDQEATVFALDGGGQPELARRLERLNDRELRLLDRQGQRITSSLNYVLTRVSELPTLDAPASARLTAPAATGPQPAAMVTDMASGWPINLIVGQELAARLTAERASGAHWSLRTGSDGGVVALLGEPAYESPSGAPAVEVFRLKATKPGRTTITFDYRKAAAAEAVKSVSYPVTVQ